MKMGAEASLDVMRADWMLDLIAKAMMSMHHLYLPGSTLHGGTFLLVDHWCSSWSKVADGV
jgi:hypothetical protein